MRKIEVFSQKTGYKSFNSSATTWADFKRELLSAGYDLSGQSATENIQKKILEESDFLPIGDFKIFLRQTDAKGGASDEMIKRIEEDPDILLYLNLNLENWRDTNDEFLEEFFDDDDNFEESLNETSEYISAETEEFIEDLESLIDYYEDNKIFERYLIKLLEIKDQAIIEFSKNSEDTTKSDN